MGDAHAGSSDQPMPKASALFCWKPSTSWVRFSKSIRG